MPGMVCNLKKRRIWKIAIACTILVFLPLFAYLQNNMITITEIHYENESIPSSFSGLRILQVSDLHNKEFGNQQHQLAEMTKEADPDIILITGDIIDCSHPDIEAAMDYVDAAVQIAPVYFAAGNHESWSGLYTILSERLIAAGVIILDNQSIYLEKGDEQIAIIGIQDPEFFESDSDFIDTLASLKKPDCFSILLSHRPEMMEFYTGDGYDLIFAGHAHGGQIRLPGIRGIYAPDQGFFPEYSSGMYTEENTSMIVSRGLGNSVIPLRILNQPELILVTLSCSISDNPYYFEKTDV